jgi:SulP family sulfate permease
MAEAPASRRALDRALPFLSRLKGYDGRSLRGDLVAGLTVAAILVPQAMAYAMLAGLPPVYGLYAGVAAPAIAALWGSLRQLATGPIAITSLLVLTTLTPLAEAGTQGYIDLAFQLALMVGVIYLVVGLLRGGVVMSFISNSAVRGFTAAASLIIVTTQLPHLLGIEVTRHEYMLSMLIATIEKLPSIHLPTAAVGLASLALIYGLKRLRAWIPAGLLTLVLASVVVYLLGLGQSGVAVVGAIPSGLPLPHLPAFDLTVTGSLVGPAVVIALVSFAETYSVSKTISAETKQRVDVDQEFIGQGLANLVGSLFQSYPVSGSLSRSAINYSAGAVSGISGLVSSLMVIVVLLFLTPLFTQVPKAVLAAVVISAVLLLFHPGQVFALWRMNRDDGVVAIAVFVLVLVAKPDYALLIGVVISLVFFLWRTMHPRIVTLTTQPGRSSFVNAEKNGIPSCSQILYLRSDNAIYFANAQYTFRQILERVDAAGGPLRFLLLDFSAVGFIDITGIDELRTLIGELEQRSIQLLLVDVHHPVRRAFARAGLIGERASDQTDGPQRFRIRSRTAALEEMLKEIDLDYCRSDCPCAVFNECATAE